MIDLPHAEGQVSTVKIVIEINTRAYEWLKWLTKGHRGGVKYYANLVLLRHLEQLPGVDLSQSPFSEPIGGSDEPEDSSEGC